MNKHIAALGLAALALPVAALNTPSAIGTSDGSGRLTVCITGADSHTRAETYTSSANQNTHQGLGGGLVGYRKLRNGCYTNTYDDLYRVNLWYNPKAPYYIKSVRTQQTAGSNAATTIRSNQRDITVVLDRNDDVTVTLKIGKRS